MCMTRARVRSAPGPSSCPVADTDPVTTASLLDDGTEPPGLRPVAIGAERLRLDARVRLGRGLAPGARLISAYGLIEVAGCETWFETGRLPGPVEDPARHACVSGSRSPAAQRRSARGRSGSHPRRR